MKNKHVPPVYVALVYGAPDAPSGVGGRGRPPLHSRREETDHSDLH